VSKSIPFTCPNCGNIHKNQPEWIGPQARCKACGHQIVLGNAPVIPQETAITVRHDDDWMDDSGVSPEDAFRGAVRKALADGIVTAAEREQLLDLCGKSGIESATAKRIFDEEKAAAIRTEPQSLSQVDVTKTVKLLQLAAKASETGNHTEALAFCNKALEEDPQNYQAWFLKGKSTGWLSPVGNLRLSEMRSNFAHAFDFAPVDKKLEVMRAGWQIIAEVSWIWFQSAHDHMKQFSSLTSAWTDFICHASLALQGLDNCQLLDDPAIAKQGVEISRILIGGIFFRDHHGNTGTQFLSPEYEQLIRAKMETYAELIRRTEPNYQLPQVSKIESGCFIVTAVCGRPDHPTVTFLRRFRDEWLVRQWFGPSLIRQYLNVGPKLARVLRRRKLLRQVTRSLIVKPAVVFACVALKKWPPHSAVRCDENDAGLE